MVIREVAPIALARHADGTSVLLLIAEQTGIRWILPFGASEDERGKPRLGWREAKAAADGFQVAERNRAVVIDEHGGKRLRHEASADGARRDTGARAASAHSGPPTPSPDEYAAVPPTPCRTVS